jgi:hypothetical protein
MTEPIDLSEPESTLDEAERIHEDLDQAHTLVGVARRLIWMSEGDGNEPTPRMKPIIDTLNHADDQLDAILADLRAIIDAAESGAQSTPRPPSRLH